MNAEEAKLIVQCRRPCGRDDTDPVISEALDVLRGDAAAMAEVQRESDLDAAISACLRKCEPPADLQRKILVGARVSRGPRWFFRPVWLAVAACVAVAAPLAVKFWPGPSAPLFATVSLADFQAATTQKLNDGPKLQRLGNMDAVREHIAGHSKMKSVPVPENLCHCPGGAVGCEVFSWQGQEVTLICFNAGRTGTVHLFTVDAAALQDRPGGAIYVPVNGWHTRTWVNGGKLLMLAGSEKQATAEDLEALAVASR